MSGRLFLNTCLPSGRRLTAEELALRNVFVSASENEEELCNQAMAYAGAFKKQRPIFGELKKRKHRELFRILEEVDPEYLEPLNLMMSQACTFLIYPLMA